MDFSKYDPLKREKQEESIQSMTCGIDVLKGGPSIHPAWMASAPVILLIEYLRKHPDQGATLHACGDVLGLRFKPGINAADLRNGRGQVANNMFNLLQDAAQDLRSMIAQGIEIPLLIHHQPKAKVQ